METSAFLMPESLSFFLFIIYVLIALGNTWKIAKFRAPFRSFPVMSFTPFFEQGARHPIFPFPARCCIHRLDSRPNDWTRVHQKVRLIAFPAPTKKHGKKGEKNGVTFLGKGNFFGLPFDWLSYFEHFSKFERVSNLICLVEAFAGGQL